MKKLLYASLSLLVVTSFSCRKKDNPDDFSKMLGDRQWTGTDAGREYVFSHNYRNFSYDIDRITIRSVNKTTVEMMGSNFMLSGRGYDRQFEFTEVDGTHSRGGLSFSAQAKLVYYPVGDSIKYELHYNEGGFWEDMVMVAR